MQIMTAQSADGSSADFAHAGDQLNGLMNVYVSGTLGGGTLTLEAKLPDGSGYVPISGGVITETGAHVLSMAPFTGRATLTGATTPSVSVWVEADTNATRTRVGV